tara:strand:+ start:197 stop:379 length:183 start_codon:yes stop_codon:yes gene_type:complete
MTPKQKQAIDLVIEDLHTQHHEIRSIAKTLQCEKELDEIKVALLEYLYKLKAKNEEPILI